MAVGAEAGILLTLLAEELAKRELATHGKGGCVHRFLYVTRTVAAFGLGLATGSRLRCQFHHLVGGLDAAIGGGHGRWIGEDPEAEDLGALQNDVRVGELEVLAASEFEVEVLEPAAVQDDGAVPLSAGGGRSQAAEEESAFCADLLPQLRLEVVVVEGGIRGHVLEGGDVGVVAAQHHQVLLLVGARRRQWHVECGRRRVGLVVGGLWVCLRAWSGLVGCHSYSGLAMFVCSRSSDYVVDVVVERKIVRYVGELSIDGCRQYAGSYRYGPTLYTAHHRHCLQSDCSLALLDHAWSACQHGLTHCLPHTAAVICLSPYPAMPSNAASSVRSAGYLDAQIPGAFPDARSLSSASITTHQVSLSQALYNRRDEYTRSKHVRIKVGSWNTGAQKGTEQDVGAWFAKGKGVEEAMAGLGVSNERGSAGHRERVDAQETRFMPSRPSVPHRDPGSVPGGEDVDIYVLGLQEIVDITSATEALRPYTDPSAAKKWKASLEAALPKGYQLVSEQQLIGLWLVIYASPDVFPQIKNVSTTSVGTGLMGYMGNKGAVTTRIVLGETTRLVFINSHLAAGADKSSLDRRNWDAAQVNSRTRFDPITDALGSTPTQGEGLGDEEFAFWFGDLNYRLEGMPGDDVRRLLTVHTKDLDHDAEGQPSTSGDSGHGSKASTEIDRMTTPPELDPASLQTTIASLLPHDELHQQMTKGAAFHDGWEEGPIRFLPTYKYDVGKVGVFDSSEKRRCPSWCDRILYRTRASKQRHDAKVKEKEDAHKRDEEMRAKGMDLAGDEDILFDYDPETDGDNNAVDEYDEDEDPEPEAVTTKDGLSDELLLEYYTTHMRVLSSDHKPLDAVFSLKYDAVVPELKTAIHAEVVRELDRQENEGRPSIAVVVDRATGSPSTEEQEKTDSNFEGVDFGDVKFGKSKRRAVTIANTGRVPAIFGFADRPVDQEQDSGPFPSWLSVTFDREPDKRDRPKPDDVHERYTLAPAEVINAELRLKIENVSAVRSLNEGANTLEEVLVLRVEDGRDHFLPLRAHWLPSTLARTIDKLVKIPEGGIRKLQHQTPDHDEVKWSVPREVFRLTEAIEDMTERALAEWDMTKADGERAPFKDNAGWPFVQSHKNLNAQHHYREEELADLYDALDCDTPFAKAFDPETRTKDRVELLAEVLLTFLSSLTDGVITRSLWERLEEGLTTRERSRQVLSTDDEKMWALEILAAAPSHNATFLLLLSFLQNLTNQIVEASKPKPETPRASMDLPASPEVKVRRRTLSKVPEVAIRQLITRNYAVVFVDALFRCKEEAKMKEKDKATRKERMIRVIELFLSTGEE